MAVNVAASKSTLFLVLYTVMYVIMNTGRCMINGYIYHGASALTKLSTHRSMQNRWFKYNNGIRSNRLYNSKKVCLEQCSIVPQTITLSDDEATLLDTFYRVVQDEELGTTIRVAGGWVRDKLLNVAVKKDIDIALDNMSGKDFVTILNKWSKTRGLKTIQIGIIQQNPEKSKHLETATAHIGQFAVDFVNLRTETYSADSRIPNITIGTPYEDAMRRDLTINSLYYNVNTKEIEDYTKVGYADLLSGLIQTPLQALITLQDDPLRALRAVRFACRFGFSMSPELVQASGDASVKEALHAKVSKERINQEIDSMMMSTYSSTRAAVLLHQLQLWQLILPVPEEAGIANTSTSIFDQGVSLLLLGDSLSKLIDKSKYPLLHSLLSRIHPCTSNNVDKEMETKLKVYRYACLTYALDGCSISKKSGKATSVVEHVLHNSLKCKNKDVDSVLLCQSTSNAFDQISKSMNDGSIDNSAIDADFQCEYHKGVGRLPLGIALMASEEYTDQAISLKLVGAVLGHVYSDTLFNELIVESKVADLYNNTSASTSPSTGGNTVSQFVLGDDGKRILSNYETILEAIQVFKLDRVWQLQPHMNGSVIKGIFPNIAPVTFMKDVLKAQIHYMLCHPDAAPEDCKLFLMRRFSRFL